MHKIVQMCVQQYICLCLPLSPYHDLLPSKNRTSIVFCGFLSLCSNTSSEGACINSPLTLNPSEGISGSITYKQSYH